MTGVQTCALPISWPTQNPEGEGNVGGRPRGASAEEGGRLAAKQDIPAASARAESLFLQGADVGDNCLDLSVSQLAFVGGHLVFAVCDGSDQLGVRGLDDGRILEG